MEGDKGYIQVLDLIDCICGEKAIWQLVNTTYNFNNEETKDNKKIVVKNIPMYKCNICNERYTDFATNIQIERLAYNAMINNQEEIEFYMTVKDREFLIKDLCKGDDYYGKIST
jgi:YgiT-type zinc finger domain-containing protein